MNNSYTSISVYGEDSDVNVILAAGRLAGLKITDGRARPQSQPNVANTDKDKDKDKDNPNNSKKGKKLETKEDVTNYVNAEQELDIGKRSKPFCKSTMSPEESAASLSPRFASSV